MVISYRFPLASGVFQDLVQAAFTYPIQATFTCPPAQWNALRQRVGTEIGVCHLVAIFGKRQKVDLSAAERRAVAALVRKLEEEP